MQFLYAIEQQFHMSHLFKHLKICKTSHNQDFFLTCVHTIASDHGRYVSCCPERILPCTGICPGKRASQEIPLSDSLLLVWKLQNVIFDPKNEQPRICTPSRNRAAT